MLTTRNSRCTADCQAREPVRKACAGDSEAVLDSGGKTVVLAEAARHKPDEARELKRIISKVICLPREANDVRTCHPNTFSETTCGGVQD